MGGHYVFATQATAEGEVALETRLIWRKQETSPLVQAFLAIVREVWNGETRKAKHSGSLILCEMAGFGDERNRNLYSLEMNGQFSSLSGRWIFRKPFPPFFVHSSEVTFLT